MECSSMFFPIQVKQERPDDGYEPIANHSGNFFSPSHHHHFLAPPLPPHPAHIAIKSDPGLLDLQSPRSGLGQLSSTVDSRGIINAGNSSLYQSSNSGNGNGNDLSKSSKSKPKKKKIKQEEPEMNVLGKQIKQEKITDTFKVRKKVDRFNGMSEEDVVKRTLPDHLAIDLDIVIVGINPGLYAAFKGHHYAGPGNHFWKCLYLSGIIPDPMTADDDYRLIEYGIGFTNIVNRTTRGSADLSRKEIREGAQILQEKLQKYRPKIAVFNGKGIYEVFSGRKNFDFGKQPEPIEGTNTLIYVMPSSSARCAQLPRAVDKVPFYVALKKLREHLCGRLPSLRDSEVCFPDVKLKVESGTDDASHADDAGDDNSGDMNQMRGNGGNEEDPYRRSAANVPHAQRNFHQHPLGRAALAAAAACGGYMEETMARVEKSQQLKSSMSSLSSHSDTSKKAKKKKGDNEDDDDMNNSHHHQHHNLLQNIKCETDMDSSIGGNNQNGTVSNGRSSPQSQQQQSPQQQRSSNDYSTSPRHHHHPHHHHSQLQRPSPHPMATGYCPAPGYGVNHMTTSTTGSGGAGELHSPYGSPTSSSYVNHPHHITIKQEKLDSMIDGNGRLSSPGTAGSQTSALLAAGYPSSVGCLYNGGAGYGQTQAPYFGGSPSPYGVGYHHLSPHLHHSAQDLFGQLSPPSVSASSSSSRENGLRGHHAQSTSSTQQIESQYFASGGTTTTSSSTSAGATRASPYSPLGSPPHGCKDSSSPVVTAFHHYPSPPSYHPHFNHLQTPATATAAQYCPDGSPPPSVYDHQSAAPLYANLETVKIKHERLDPSYDNYS